jgi:hypothetical protein
VDRFLRLTPAQRPFARCWGHNDCMSCRSGSDAADAAANLIVRRCRRQRDDLFGKNRSRPSSVRTESAVTLGLCPEQYDRMLEGADQASMRSTLQRTSCSHGAGGRMAACSGQQIKHASIETPTNLLSTRNRRQDDFSAGSRSKQEPFDRWSDGDSFSLWDASK